MQYASKIICEWELPEKSETIKVHFNKKKLLAHLKKEQNELNVKHRLLDKQERAKRVALIGFMEKKINKSD